MPGIVTFIGWHNSGKTTLATAVVRHLRAAGYRVGAIKSSKETGIAFDRPGTDTDKHRQAGAEAVCLVASDQLVLTAKNHHLPLGSLVSRYFPEVDLVIGEGFKSTAQVAKIEVVRDRRHGPLLRDQVQGVIATATDLDLAPPPGGRLFRLHESLALAGFIEERFLRKGKVTDTPELLVNGVPLLLSQADRELAASFLKGLVAAQQLSGEAHEIELRLKLGG